ncbi:isomerase [Streptomyces sp. TG1A-8]|uniref:isomerase n=1 Tax=Streptomyces sp. TG1A-8 TaxID=3051385 RepID=UPI00265BC395|nr:isomerase [Streptomyces sp. TG1A-8]MDO0928005.1 isomerase [Streptomyces sp. TG1A-8]
MPQITVGCSSVLEDSFARAVHEAAVGIAAAAPEACRTLSRRGDRTAYGYEEPGQERHAVVHVTPGLLAGRSEETKERLTQAVLDLLRTHVAAQDGLTLHASAETRELDPSYRRFQR